MKPWVLIVDDSLTVRMDLQEAFDSIGFATSTSDTLAAARKALAEQRFSLVILDVLLPDGDGVKLLREIKNAAPTAAVPVVLLSTEGEVHDRVRGLKTGADEYVGKPYDRANLLACARHLVKIEKRSAASGLRLLLIDDSVTFRNEFKAVLENSGYEVVTAENGEEGLRTVVAVRPDAVIVNSVLPGIDGAAVIRRLKDDISLRNTPCLLLTATESAGDELRTLEAGADAYARKSMDAQLILSRIVALLRSLGPQVGEPTVAGLLGPKKILTVDDSPTYLHELAEALRKEGYDIIPARSGKEALELLEVEQVDCILLDLVMPELSGQETCRIIKQTQAWRNVPLLILTAVEETKAMVEGINAGADDYIPKSSDFEVLKARLRAQLRRKQFEDENRTIRERLLQKEIEAARAKAAQEIAEARASFEPLLRNEAWLNSVVRIAHLGAWDWDLLKNTQSWSDEQFRIFGLEPGAVEPSYDRFLHALDLKDRQRVAEIVQQALSNQPRFQIDCRLVWPNGELRHAVCQGEICRDETGKAVRIIGTVLDLTAAKQGEAALQESEQNFRTLADFVPQMVWMCTPDGLNVYFNQRWVEYTGMTLEESYGRGWNTPFHPNDKQAAWDAWNHAIASGDPYRVESRLRAADGRYRWFLMRGMPLSESSGKIVKWFGTCTDIDDLKRSEEATRNLNAELEERVQQRTADLVAVNKELEAFNYAVAHDLRGPLRHIHGFAEILAEQAGPNLDDASKNHLQAIQKGAQHMARLLEDLLTLARLGRQELSKQDCGLSALVNEVVTTLQPEIKDREVEWRIAELPFVDCDPTLMKQVLFNLLANALKFTQTRERAIIEVGQTTLDGVPVFFVRDNGVGFNMKFAEKLFGLFQRLHRQEDFEGTGVGLAIVQRIIQRHGGRVWAEAELNKGASFYFTLCNRESETEEQIAAQTTVG